ncbi:aldo/keto reductase [Nocardiopsis sp. RSe5-2]|uniref:Aldo/keto reductase n=1 Tax=Nocardiopsis endophytica TaxID=3018445 RepID=A0ABT4TYQ3_9ACTN|nr:aldo/keto reductase [Nocardiopsis endophytica]MDA2809828.1 aldo/keto reductase [Nocardiopsis endophytica]
MRYTTIGSGQAARRVSSLCLGALPFGTTVDEATSFRLLDRFVEAGGTFVDTSNNYAFWAPGGRGGESESLLGRWRAARGIGDEVVVCTKSGALPSTPGTSYEDGSDGLSPAALDTAAEASARRLGTERLDVLLGHIEDHHTPIEKTAEAYASLADQDRIGIWGLSNHTLPQLERARAADTAAGRLGAQVLQYRYSYTRPRHWDPMANGRQVAADDGILEFVRRGSPVSGQPVLMAYSPLLNGSYTRQDRPLPEVYDHAGTHRRLAALDEVTARTGATRNQVVLAWLMAHDVPVVPVFGASTTGQLEEALESADLELAPQDREVLDAADPSPDV